MIGRISGLIVCLIAMGAPVALSAQEERARSILVLDQSGLRGPFYQEIFAKLRDAVNADLNSHVTLYRETLDSSRFTGEAYEEGLRQYLKVKYQNRPIGVIVAIGAATLAHVERWRPELWPGVPIVFELVDETLGKPARIDHATGGLVRLRLADAVEVARAVVPNLDRIVFVGDEWNRQVVFASWKDELASATAGLEVTELIGVKMAYLLQRVAAQPDRSAIIYSAVYSNGEGTFFPPTIALGFIAEKANRPIVVASEPYLERGGIGGFVLQPGVIGTDAAKRALQIINGKAVADIPVTTVDAVKPIFNWLQMRRWNVDEGRLPPGSEIRFRAPNLWERYRWQSVFITAALLVQASLISILLNERKRRGNAELEARQRLSQLAHVHREAIASEFAASIAHELNQPLGSILTNAETAELILESSKPDLSELKDILADIRHDDLRASRVIAHMRSLLRRTPFELKEVDLNEIMHEAFDLISAEAETRNVSLHLKTWTEPLRVKGDSIQLQQVILNLLVNGMDAMATLPFARVIIARTEAREGNALISISDSGSGIPAEKLSEIFERFFTTKDSGMGVGLSIVRTIVHAHKGRIWAESQPEGGATFFASLPLLPS